MAYRPAAEGSACGDGQVNSSLNIPGNKQFKLLHRENEEGIVSNIKYSFLLFSRLWNLFRNLEKNIFSHYYICFLVAKSLYIDCNFVENFSIA